MSKVDAFMSEWLLAPPSFFVESRVLYEANTLTRAEECITWLEDTDWIELVTASAFRPTVGPTTHSGVEGDPYSNLGIVERY